VGSSGGKTSRTENLRSILEKESSLGGYEGGFSLRKASGAGTSDEGVRGETARCGRGDAAPVSKDEKKGSEIFKPGMGQKWGEATWPPKTTKG